MKKTNEYNVPDFNKKIFNNKINNKMKGMYHLITLWDQNEYDRSKFLEKSILLKNDNVWKFVAANLIFLLNSDFRFLDTSSEAVA